MGKTAKSSVCKTSPRCSIRVKNRMYRIGKGKEKSMGTRRLEKIDICKGILIILMVTGHATGRFNFYIYQFHMAAFFFLSGYCSNQLKNGVFHTTYNKLCTILLPAVVSGGAGITGLWILDKAGLQVTLLGTEFPGWATALKALFLNGDPGVNILGANWFLLALFGVYVVNRIVLLLSSGRVNTRYILFSIGLYMAGYGYVTDGIPLRWGMLPADLILIAQLFFAVGYICRCCGCLEHREINRVILIVTAILVVVAAQKAGKVTVDWPARDFNGSIHDFFIAMNGTLFVYTLAEAVSALPLRRIRNALGYIGRNTLGILLLHFGCFKILFVLAYYAGIIPKSDIACLTPGQMSSKVLVSRLWPFIVVFSIAISLVLWRTANRSRIIRIFVGEERELYASGWERLQATPFMRQIKSVRDVAAAKMTETYLACRREIGRRPLYYFFALLLLMLAAIPMYRQGIVCGEELFARLASTDGAKEFYRQMAAEYMGEERMLASKLLVGIIYLGFLGPVNGGFKIVQILTILIDIGLFSILMYQLVKNKGVAALCGIMLIVFVPVTFEYTAPNAFVTLYTVPFAALLSSLIFWLHYLDCRKQWCLAGSMGLLMISVISCEILVGFIPVYILLMFYRDGIRNKKNLLRTGLFPVFVGLLCLGVHMAHGGGMPREESLGSVMAAVAQQVKESFPGYYMFSEKYRGLAEMYRGITPENVVRVVLLSVIAAILVYYLLNSARKKDRERNAWKKAILVGIWLSWMLFPAVFAVADETWREYTQKDGSATWFQYFGTTALLCSLMWSLCSRIQKRSGAILCTVGMVALLLPTQGMNDMLSWRQMENFQRLTMIEGLFSTDVFAQLDGGVLAAEDLYETRDTLFVEEGYWSQYAKRKGRSIELVSGRDEEIREEPSGRLYFDGEQFCLRRGSELCVIARQPLAGDGMIKVSEGRAQRIEYGDFTEDHGYYIWFYEWNGQGELKPMSQDKTARYTVGSTLEESIKTGYYGDGWVNKSSTFLCRAGGEGIVEIGLRFPYNRMDGKKIEVYVENEYVDTLPVEGEQQTVVVHAAANQAVLIRLESNFEVADADKNGDTRELSYLMEYLEGK